MPKYYGKEIPVGSVEIDVAVTSNEITDETLLRINESIKNRECSVEIPDTSGIENWLLDRALWYWLDGADYRTLNIGRKII